MDCVVPLLALVWYSLGRTVENAVRSEVVEGPCERCTRVSDGDSYEFHPPPIMLEGRDEGRVVLLGLLRVFLVASEVSGEPNLCEDEDA